MLPIQSYNIVLPEMAIAALNQGNKIEAIKLVREVHEIGLKEAKDMVDAYIAGREDLKVKFESSANSSKMGCLVFVGFVIALLGVWFFFKKS